MPAAATGEVVLKHNDSIQCENKELEGSKEPLASNDPFSNRDLETTRKVVLSKEEERLSLLQIAIQLNIEPSTDAEDFKECLIRSIFVKRGKGANALETLFNFIVITMDELTRDKYQKLWSKIREKTKDWIKLLPAEDSRSFSWDGESKSFYHVPSKETMEIRHGNVDTILLEKLSAAEYKRSLFIILVDKQLLREEIKTGQYRFHWDRKGKLSFNFELNAKDSKYHASFDTNNPGQGLKLSKNFRSLMSNASPIELKATSTCDDPCYQTPRPFSSEFVGMSYNERFILCCWESGPKGLMKPAREFKLLRGGDTCSEDECIKKFLYETFRFACGCLNERTNGTIHFGVADEVEDQTCGYQPREIVGSYVAGKPRYNEKLTEFIDKCFVGDSRSNVHNCIRPPVFIPVKCKAVGQRSSAKVVIEVDIEPRYSFCAGEIFKADFECLGRGKGKVAAYIRHGSKTQAITEPREMEEYINRRPRLDEERKKREDKSDIYQDMAKPDSIQRLYGKLQGLLCGNKKVIDSSVYPILVLSKPGSGMNQEFLKKTFTFIRAIKWQVIIDFDDQGSDSYGLCSVFKSGPETPQVDIHEAEDYVDETVIEGIECKTHWIFANGYSKLENKAVGFKEWNNSRRKKGLNLVMQSLEKRIPDRRLVVLFLLISAEYEAMADTFKDFCTLLGGPNQLVFAAEKSEIVEDWKAKLLSTCLEQHQIRERGVVGMSWDEFQKCVQQMVSGIDQHQRYVIMASGSHYPTNVSFNNIEFVSSLECEELRELSVEERKKLSSEVEASFYRGYPVTWRNFWFTDDHKNHVLKRDRYSHLKRLLENQIRQATEGKVQTITIYHQIGAGASTMARQALWDFRCNPDLPYRCAVVTKIDNSTCKELMRFRNIGYGDDSQVIPPVLALVEDTEHSLFWELHAQVVEHCNDLPRTKWPVCVFVYCRETQNPFERYSEEKGASVFLEQHLSEREIGWFKEKYIDMKGQFHNKDPNRDFVTYANENLISFMIMKENFNRKYASGIVERNLTQVTNEESMLLEYTSLLTIYNQQAVFVSCFDNMMLSGSLLRKRKYLDWMNCLSHSARIFLREVDRSSHSGTGKAIAIIHPIIASELLDQIASRKETTVSQIVVDFLDSSLLDSKNQSFTFKDLYLCANRMLKRRKKIDYGDDTETKFAPLIEKILYGNPPNKATEQTIKQAADVLKVGLDKFRDSMLAQQMARVFYVNVAAYSESAVDMCFEQAQTFCKTAIEMDQGNSFYLDTMGRIHQKKLTVRYDPIRRKNLVIKIEDATEVISLALDAMKWFQKSQAVSADSHNSCGVRGELSVIFFLLDILRCTELFRNSDGFEKLHRYLAFCQFIPPEVQTLWMEFHESFKDLRNRSSYCIQGLSEDFAIYKVNSNEEKLLPKQIASFKAQYCCYFGEADVPWNEESPEERWEYRWHKIYQRLGGDIFSSVFSLDRYKVPPKETLEELQELAYKNYFESVDRDRYNTLLLIIATAMALHSPYGECSKCRSRAGSEEYKEMYSLVEKLFDLERKDQHGRIYAHLFKVMFLWPRKGLELSNYCVQDFYDSMEKLRKRWERKRKKFSDTDNMMKQKMYKNMTFRRQTRQYSTLFYLGKGTGLGAFVHINELSSKGAIQKWKTHQIESKLKRLTGIVENKYIIKVQNPLEPSRTIDVYYSSFREGGFSKEEVSFYLGFSWAQPIALDVKYTNKGHDNDVVGFRDALLDDQRKFVVPQYITYSAYTFELRKLTKKLEEIAVLKEMKEGGRALDENQERKLRNEAEIKEKLAELEKSLDALRIIEEEMFD